MFPIIPILAILAILGGIATLTWYTNLSKEEQTRADARMNQLALQWFQRKFSELSEAQKNKIVKKVEKEFS